MKTYVYFLNSIVLDNIVLPIGFPDPTKHNFNLAQFYQLHNTNKPVGQFIFSNGTSPCSSLQTYSICCCDCGVLQRWLWFHLSLSVNFLSMFFSFFFFFFFFFFFSFFFLIVHKFFFFCCFCCCCCFFFAVVPDCMFTCWGVNTTSVFMRCVVVSVIWSS